MCRVPFTFAQQARFACFGPRKENSTFEHQLAVQQFLIRCRHFIAPHTAGQSRVSLIDGDVFFAHLDFYGGRSAVYRPRLQILVCHSAQSQYGALAHKHTRRHGGPRADPRICAKTHAVRDHREVRVIVVVRRPANICLLRHDAVGFKIYR
jgi:hypothetical protein